VNPAPSPLRAHFFVLRTPLLPFAELAAWGEELQAPGAAGDPDGRPCPAGTQGPQAVLAADRARLRQRLREVLARPAVREALFVASPDLEASLPVWEVDPEGERGQRVERAVSRYFARMAGRATPFGLFAGSSLGRVAARTRLVLAERARGERHTRLDMDYLFALTGALARDPTLRASLRYVPNSSLYRAAGRLHYVEARVRKERDRSYHLVAVDETEELVATLARAAGAPAGCSRASAGDPSGSWQPGGGARPAELAAALVDDEITPAAAAAYVDALIASQLLVPELTPPVTGPEPIHPLLAQLGEHEAAGGPKAVLARVRDQLAALDAAGLGASPDRYRAVAGILAALPAPVELPRLFQVDLVKPAPAATLGSDVVEEIRRGVELLRRIERGPGNDRLRRFREAFVARYEEREVPLLEALDEEAGVGFAAARGAGAEVSPLLKDLPFPAGGEATSSLDARHGPLLRLIAGVLERGEHELALTPADLEALAAREPPPLPDAFAVVAELVQDERGQFRVLLEGASGPSGVRLLGRFCHADPALQAAVEEHLRAEEALRPEAVFAEIAHLPEGRIGNILCRPVLREYEIAYLGRSGVPPERQLSLTDLWVSVRGDRIVLRSARLGREVVPRLTTAHNYTWRSLPVYRFLCSLQHQGVAGGLGWEWGPLAAAPFLPRVTAGRLILALARWRLTHAELRRLGAARGDERYRAVQQLRAERRLPRWVVLADDDNALPLDLDNALLVESFVHLVRNRSQALLTELYPGPDEFVAHGPEGRYVHELVVPFVRQAGEGSGGEGGGGGWEPGSDPVGTPTRPSPHGSPTFSRTFPPGSEWLTLKLYAGESMADAAVRDLVGPLAREVLESGAAERWFFVRYGDPEWHLRLRFQGEPSRLHAEVLPRLQAAAAAWLAEGRLRRVQLDTYEREVERYGGPEGIRLVEQVFHCDSEAVLAILERVSPGDAGLDQRWRLALRGMDMLLADLGLDRAARYRVVQAERQAFAHEFQAGGPLRGAIGARFRKERAALAAILDPAHDAGSPLAPGFRFLQERSQRLAPVAAELRAHEREGRLTRPIAAIAGSVVHMHANRLLRAGHRAQELVLHDFLTRLYEPHLRRVDEPG
jgi:thiopeptide-type bacteriocin biosynthesis protein